MITNLGRHTTLPEDAKGYDGLTLDVGSFTSIASGLTVVSGQHPPIAHPECASTFPFREHGWGVYPPSGGPHHVVIGHDVWIGQDVTILDGVSIGNGAIVGAATVVAHDVPAYAVVIGNPSRLLRYRFDLPTIDFLAGLEWWNWPDSIIHDNLYLLADVELLRVSG